MLLHQVGTANKTLCNSLICEMIYLVSLSNLYRCMDSLKRELRLVAVHPLRGGMVLAGMNMRLTAWPIP